MADAKRTKGSSARRTAGDSAVAALDAAPVVDALAGDFDDLDDILGEITEPDQAAPPESLDYILGEIAGPAQAEASDDFADILNELAGPEKAAEPDDFDDILSELAGPEKTEAADDFDDILSELAGPEKAAEPDGFDDILSSIAGPAKAEAADAKPQGAGKRAAKTKPADETDDLAAMLDAMTPVAAEAPAPAAAAAPASDKPGIAAKLRRRAGALVRPLQGTREISRKRYVGLIGLAGLFGLTAIGEAAVLLMAPAHAPAAPAAAHAPQGAHESAPAVSLVPVDYSKIELTRYRDKVRSLGEGGRDMLRNPAIKKAVLDLDNGEALYTELRQLARRSKAADLVSIRDDRLTINSCNLPACADKSFKLVYDLQREKALICVTDKYLGGSYLSYSYGPDGYSEVGSCNAVG